MYLLLCYVYILLPSTYWANVRVDFADGGRALAGADGGGGVEVGRVLAALAAAVQSNWN